MESTAPSLSPIRGWVLALAATSTMAVSYVDRQTLAVLAPTVTKELGISEPVFGWLVSSFSIAYLVGAPLSGRILDAVGARRGLLAAVLAWTAVAALHALVPNIAALFALRIALGLAEAPSFPGAAQTVHRALPPARRAAGFGLLFTGSSFGAMIAPPLATFLAARYGWRNAFLGTALVGLCWLPLWIGVAFSRPARAVLDAKLDTHLQEPAPRPLELLLTAPVLRLVAVVVASAPLIGLVINWGAKYLVRDHGLTQEECGTYLIFPPLIFDLGAVAFGAIASRAAARGAIGVPRPLVAAALVLTLAAGLAPFMPGPAYAIAACSASLAGGAGLYGLATVDALARVPKRAISLVSGIGASAQSLALIIAGPLIGLSVERTGSYTQILCALTAWGLPGTLAWLLWIPPRLPESSPKPIS